MQIEDADAAALALLLSPERLGALSQLTGNVKAAIELHQETLRLGAALMNITASIEIALRNAICENLGQHFGVAGWLLTPPAPFQWKEEEIKKIRRAVDSARRSEYAKLSQAEKHALDALAFPNGRPAHLSHLNRAKARRGQIQVSDGKIIAELTFYIWKRLCGPDYEHTLWKPTLKRVFPYKKITRSEVADHLENLYQSRNRLAHHEPVLHGRFRDAVAAIKFIVEHLHASPPTDQTPLARLVAGDLVAVEAQAVVLHAKLDSYRT
ncbi:hypothetical protein M0654_22430 [Rhizobium sp. NTR19]|uniref:Abi-like protein n=1 Tax=Neorhizobium turbinariae TaxID=2937795 RepID=A0ABT0IY01_9HYPH|nr:hypothetical protein [Neorhizobium turbinariae]MCK8782724.1 hypothetical protein [Neorhizobium turbinariae]